MDIALLTSDRAIYREGIKQLISGYGHRVYDIRENLNKLNLGQFDLGLMWMFRSLVEPKHFTHFTKGIIAFHPSLLPYGRGAMPNVWTIANNEPAGVTLF